MPIIQLTKYTQNLLHYSKHSEHEDVQLASYNMLKAFRLVKMSNQSINQKRIKVTKVTNVTARPADINSPYQSHLLIVKIVHALWAHRHITFYTHVACL